MMMGWRAHHHGLIIRATTLVNKPIRRSPGTGADKADSFSPNAYPSSETIPATHLAYVAAHYPGVEDRCGRS